MSAEIMASITRVDWQCEVSGKIVDDAQATAWDRAYRLCEPVEVNGRQCIVESFTFGRPMNGAGSDFWATLREVRT